MFTQNLEKSYDVLPDILRLISAKTLLKRSTVNKIIQESGRAGDFLKNPQEFYEKTLERLLEDSKYIALSLRYPYRDYSNLELPKKYYNWQLRCCEELLKLIGSANIKSYSENGISWTKDSAYLSTELASEIEPMAGSIGSE